MMQSFEGRIAVITGGGTGMGRELARQLAVEGCHVSMCDVSEDNARETRDLCLVDAPSGTRVTTFVADVSDEAQMLGFRDHVLEAHATDHVNLVFNNAGIGGGGSFLVDDRDEWEQTFAVCWGGVYNGTRAFLPLLVASTEGHLVNTSSVNGFWASLGPSIPHTAYSAAKFAVKGFTEALVTDLRVNAPHVRCSVVMPGHIGTSIILNSGKYFGRDPKNLDEDQVAQLRERIGGQGIDVSGASDEDLRNLVVMQAEGFRDLAPMTAAEAAKVILDGVRAGSWRILVGDDARRLDESVRRDPESAYEQSFVDDLRQDGFFNFVP